MQNPKMRPQKSIRTSKRCSDSSQETLPASLPLGILCKSAKVVFPEKSMSLFKSPYTAHKVQYNNNTKGFKSSDVGADNCDALCEPVVCTSESLKRG